LEKIHQTTSCHALAIWQAAQTFSMEVNFIYSTHREEVVKTFLSLVNCVSYIFHVSYTLPLARLHITPNHTSNPSSECKS